VLNPVLGCGGQRDPTWVFKKVNYQELKILLALSQEECQQALMK